MSARAKRRTSFGREGILALTAFALLAALVSCAKGRAQKAPPVRAPLASPGAGSRATGKVTCFDALAKANGAETRALFASRKCQGGGVTWAALLGVLARRRGSVAPSPPPASEFTGDVSTLNHKARFAIDDEGDGALFCTDDPELLTAMRHDYQRLNGDANELRRAMAETTALELECLEADGSVPALPALSPLPERPASLLGAERAEIERLKQLLRRQPTWCFPPEDLEKRKGALRFAADGRVTVLADTGKEIGRGKLNWPRDGSGDTRVEVILETLPGASGLGSPLLHLNVGDSGRLGFDYILAQGTLRIDLTPGESCLRAK